MASVSIIIPAYCKNKQDLEWLDECLASVVCQKQTCEGSADTSQDVSQGDSRVGSVSPVCEVVVWDDGSLVDLAPVRNRYAASGKGRVKWGGGGGKDINCGVSVARNRAVEIASGPLLFPVDCDDVLVPDAISILLAQWDGTPLYPDIYKFGVDNIPHYQLLDFVCKHLAKKVGIASVGVLHSKEQWKSVGGWDEQLDFYEDGEYNARLFLNYCAVRVKQPLYGYRTHADQRTKLNEYRSVQMMRKVLAMVQDYERSGVMRGGCPGCSPRRTRPTNPNPPAATVSQSTPPRRPFAQRAAELPGSAGGGKVFARYIGGAGKGTHYYRGPATKFAYKVRHDDIVAVDHRDASDPSDPGHAQQSLLVLIERERPSVSVSVSPPPSPPPPAPAPPVREPVRSDVVRLPVVPIVEVEKGAVEDLPNITLIPYRLLVTMDIAPDVAVRLLDIETKGKNRRKHIAYLGRRVRSDS